MTDTNNIPEKPWHLSVMASLSQTADHMEIDGPGGVPIAGQNKPEVSTAQLFSSFVLSGVRDVVGRKQRSELVFGPRVDLSYSASWADRSRKVGDESRTEIEETSHRITPMAGVVLGLEMEPESAYDQTMGGVSLFFLGGEQLFPGQDVGGDLSSLLALKGGVTITFIPTIHRDGKPPLNLGLAWDMGFNRMYNTISDTAQYGFYTALGIQFRFE